MHYDIHEDAAVVAANYKKGRDIRDMFASLMLVFLPMLSVSMLAAL